MDGSDRIRRLRWLCRRGMKELDILLERFVDLHQARLEQGAWPGFEQLLEQEDDVLWDWLQNPVASDDEALIELLKDIRGTHA